MCNSKKEQRRYNLGLTLTLTFFVAALPEYAILKHIG